MAQIEPQRPQHAAGYEGRESKSTRNPHSAASANISTLSRELAKLPYEERVLAQWRAAFGCPVSDEAKAQFSISALDHTYGLSDVRLWKIHHPDRTSSKDAGSDSNKGIIYLEFFFDGMICELAGQEEVWTQAFERMIEQQLQERRIAEFRKKLTARRRGGNSTASRNEDNPEEASGGDDDWRSFLQKPLPSTQLSIRSMREAGCMLRFVVCQTSLSISASEVLGQIAFQEHFPIDGVAQEPSSSTKPLPQWVYGMLLCTAALAMLTILAWWQLVKRVALVGGSSGNNHFS